MVVLCDGGCVTVWYVCIREHGDAAVCCRRHGYSGCSAESALLQGQGQIKVIHQGHVKAKVKSLCMTAVIVAAFIICWTPYQVLFISPHLTSSHLISDTQTHTRV